MKKTSRSGLCLLLAMMLLFALTGCGDAVESDNAGIAVNAKTEDGIDTKVTVPSQITGGELATELGMTAGIYAVEHYNWNQAECLLPDPAAWSGGRLQLNDTSEGSVVLPDASLGAESIYYIFKADSAETMQECMDGYLQELAALGFSCESKRMLRETWHYLTKDGYPELLIAPDSTTEMSIALPLCYGFEVSAERRKRRF